MDILLIVVYGILFFILGLFVPIAVLFIFGLCIVFGISFWYFVLSFVALIIAIYGVVYAMIESMFK